MQTLRLGLPAATAALLALAAPLAWGAGFGSPGTAAVLGQPLNFAVPLRLEPGDPIEPRCVTAQVTVGERRLTDNLVSTAVEMTGTASARIRVFTSVSIDEPVVGVLLDVGCQTRLSRRFVVLADPPGLFDPAPAAAAPVVPAQMVLPAADAVAAAAASAPAVTPSPASGRATQRTQTQAQTRTQTRTQTQAQTQAQTPTQADRRPARATRAPAAAEARPERRRARSDTAVAATGAAAANAAPRLMLDAATREPALSSAEMAAVEQALQAVAEAASAVRSANQAASAAEQRAQGLARANEQLQAEARVQREATATVRERLARAESESRWFLPLLAGVLMLGALAGWLWWQLAALRREQRADWQMARERALLAAYSENAVDPQAAATPLTPLTPPASLPATLPPSGVPSTRGRAPSTPAWPPPAPAAPPVPALRDTVVQSDFAPSTQGDIADLADREPPPAMQRTLPLPPAPPARAFTSPGQAPLRDLTIEELIDLEQQAEFFIVLGQDEAAIDLLVEHARSTGGSSPLPYLKLLEIYHRRGDREAYERTRTRFNQRFNAYAADWGAGLQQGRGLEDYPEVLPRLVLVWARPLDAMAELEALLFRKSQGELFDLPAYREVLFLYALARDLLDREAADTGNVDLLLPLTDGGDFGVTTPHPYFGLDHDSVFDRQAVEDRPTSPVDLDLSQADDPVRIFDPLAASRPPGKPEG